jgi:hypothetical protein
MVCNGCPVFYEVKLKVLGKLRYECALLNFGAIGEEY